LMSNDTQWANALTDPSSHVDKTYHVQVRGQPDDAMLARLAVGVTDATSGEELRAKRLSVVRVGSRSTCWLEVVLDEGKNRQIRRLLEAESLEVLRLVRIAIGLLALGTHEKGSWLLLKPAEIESLRP